MQEFMQFVSNHPILILAWIVLLFSLILTIFQTKFSRVSEIVCGEVIRLINKEDALILDLRNRDDYCKGHIINSLNLTESYIISGISGKLGELEKEKGKPVVVVCANGATSHRSIKNLMKAGFKRIYVLKGGIYSWSRESLPLVRGK